MLDQIDLEEILFLDIETVPAAPAWEHVTEEEKALWAEKSRFIREKNGSTLEESYAQAGIYAEFGKVVCVSCGYFSQRMGETVFRVRSFADDSEEVVLAAFADLLEKHCNNPFRMLCAHNGKEFDFPYLCRRMLVNGVRLPRLLNIAGKKPWEIPHLDTMELWKFGDYKHYTSLKLLAHLFHIPTPKDDIDGSMVRTVYYDERNLERIAEYCKKDVITVAQLVLRFRGQALLEEFQLVHI